MPGRKVVILGSGDIGLIMARRMTLEGAKVQVVAELMPYSGGLKRNIVQCLDDYQIPLLLSHTVVDIKGKKRVEGVTIAKVDDKGKPISGTEEFYECDTLLLSCGLIPENELSGQMGVTLNPVTSGPFVDERLETNIPGVFACGNVLHVHDLVDFVSMEAKTAGESAAAYLQHKLPEGEQAVKVKTAGGVRYTVPSTICVNRMEEKQIIRFRVGGVYRNCFLRLYFDGEKKMEWKKKVMAPGEMEQIILLKSQLEAAESVKEITLSVEGE